jgi:beta-lactamase regulating signal transducer with metallopeptidase domain
MKQKIIINNSGGIMKDINILAIESSCDETSVSIIRNGERRNYYSSIIANRYS